MKTANHFDMTGYEHTTGPWMIFEGGDIGSAAVRLPETIVIRSGTVKGRTIGEAMMNAKLISAAPELMASLNEMVSNLVSHAKFGLNESEVAMLQRADQAIRKANGAIPA